MAEITFISNKTRKETFKYVFVIVSAIISWILQVSIFSNLSYFDTTASLLLLGAIYFGFNYGPMYGTLFGIIASFFSASILHDHTFFFSYPLIGLLSGLLTKNLFSDELLYFLTLSFILSFLLEFLNGWQYSLKNPINITDRYFLVSFNSATLNLFLSPFYYTLMKYLTKL